MSRAGGRRRPSVRPSDDPQDRAGEPPGGPREASSGQARAELEALRLQIQELDESLVRLIRERDSLVERVGQLKRQLGLPILDPPREAAVVRKVVEVARREGVDEELVRDLMWRLMAASREIQRRGAGTGG